MPSCSRGENRFYIPGSQLPSPELPVDYLQDANWDTTAVVGFNGTTGTWGVTQRYVYSPYGSITVLNADWSTPPAGTQPMVNNLYQGMTLDAATGLYDERFRNYNPSLGIWISQDPLQYVNGADTYQFVMGNPAGAVDSAGSATTRTWNTCCPRAFALLEQIGAISGPAQDSVARTLKHLGLAITMLRFASGAFAKENAANSKESLVGLLLENVATIDLTGAVAMQATEVKQLRGLITNSRLVKGGTRGFLALSTSAKVALRIADSAAIYGAIAAWGTSEFINAADIGQTARIANLLANSVAGAHAVYEAGVTRFKNVDRFNGALKDLFNAHNGKAFGNNDVISCDALVRELERMLPIARQAAAGDMEWATGLYGLTSKLEASLGGLLRPS